LGQECKQGWVLSRIVCGNGTMCKEKSADRKTDVDAKERQIEKEKKKKKMGGRQIKCRWPLRGEELVGASMRLGDKHGYPGVKGYEKPKKNLRGAGRFCITRSNDRIEEANRENEGGPNKNEGPPAGTVATHVTTMA